MIYPLLDSSLHTHLHQPINVIGCGFMVRRTCHEFVYLVLRITFLGIESLCLHPCEELGVIDNVFFEAVTRFVHKVDVYVGIIGVNLAATHIDGHEYGFDARSSLRHKACSACGGNRQTSYIATTILYHVGIKFGGLFFDAQYEGIIRFTLSIVYAKRTAFPCHFHA